MVVQGRWAERDVERKTESYVRGKARCLHEGKRRVENAFQTVGRLCGRGRVQPAYLVDRWLGGIQIRCAVFSVENSRQKMRGHVAGTLHWAQNRRTAN